MANKKTLLAGERTQDYGPSSSKCSGCGERYTAFDAHLHANHLVAHSKKKGDRVRIYNGVDREGKPRLEGVATIKRHLDTEEYYMVKFDGEAKHYARFVNTDGSEVAQ